MLCSKVATILNCWTRVEFLYVFCLTEDNPYWLKSLTIGSCIERVIFPKLAPHVNLEVPNVARIRRIQLLWVFHGVYRGEISQFTTRETDLLEIMNYDTLRVLLFGICEIQGKIQDGPLPVINGVIAPGPGPPCSFLAKPASFLLVVWLFLKD